MGVCLCLTSNIVQSYTVMHGQSDLLSDTAWHYNSYCCVSYCSGKNHDSSSSQIKSLQNVHNNDS